MTDLIGEIGINHCGTPMKIVGARSGLDIDVQFLDGASYIKSGVSYSNFKKGAVKNPYDTTVYGVGYIGDGVHLSKEHGKPTLQYASWRNMLSRCYHDHDKEKYPSYYGVATVCDRWLNFQTFADWYDDNAYPVEGRLHVDKDILYPGNKMYAPDRCLLVPQRINMLFTNRTNHTGLPNGIKRTKNGKFVAAYNCKYLGTFDQEENAFVAYATAKKTAIVQVANEYRRVIPRKVYDALCSYQIESTNDKNCVSR